jgi:hypothetical protein
MLTHSPTTTGGRAPEGGSYFLTVRHPEFSRKCPPDVYLLSSVRRNYSINLHICSVMHHVSRVCVLGSRLKDKNETQCSGVDRKRRSNFRPQEQVHTSLTDVHSGHKHVAYTLADIFRNGTVHSSSLVGRSRRTSQDSLARVNVAWRCANEGQEDMWAVFASLQRRRSARELAVLRGETRPVSCAWSCSMIGEQDQAQSRTSEIENGEEESMRCFGKLTVR